MLNQVFYIVSDYRKKKLCFQGKVLLKPTKKTSPVVFTRNTKSSCSLQNHHPKDKNIHLSNFNILNLFHKDKKTVFTLQFLFFLSMGYLYAKTVCNKKC